MSRLTNLAHWTGPTTSLRPIGKHVEIPPHDENSGREDARPNERIGAYGFQSQLWQECEIVLTTRSVANEAAALSFMTASRHDVRPWLLLAMYGQDERAIAACLLYAVRYLTCATQGQHSEAAIDAAAADALSVLYRRRARLSADDRARSLRMRAQPYRQLRRLALTMFRRRLREACVLFHTGRIHTHELPYLELGRSHSPPLASSSCARPRHAGQLSLSTRGDTC